LWGQNVYVENCVGLDPASRGGTGTVRLVHVNAGGDVRILGGIWTPDTPDMFEVLPGGKLTRYAEAA
jgi:hypothetical protein